MAALSPNELGLWGFLNQHGPSNLERLCKAGYTDEKDMLRYLQGLIDKGYAVFDKKEDLYKLK